MRYSTIPQNQTQQYTTIQYNTTRCRLWKRRERARPSSAARSRRRQSLSQSHATGGKHRGAKTYVRKPRGAKTTGGEKHRLRKAAGAKTTWVENGGGQHRGVGKWSFRFDFPKGPLDFVVTTKSVLIGKSMTDVKK